MKHQTDELIPLTLLSEQMETTPRSGIHSGETCLATAEVCVEGKVNKSNIMQQHFSGCKLWRTGLQTVVGPDASQASLGFNAAEAKDTMTTSPLYRLCL